MSRLIERQVAAASNFHPLRSDWLLIFRPWNAHRSRAHGDWAATRPRILGSRNSSISPQTERYAIESYSNVFQNGLKELVQHVHQGNLAYPRAKVSLGNIIGYYRSR